MAGHPAPPPEHAADLRADRRWGHHAHLPGRGRRRPELGLAPSLAGPRAPPGDDARPGARVPGARGPGTGRDPGPGRGGLCTDESVDDHPFVVSEFVEGHILRDARHAEVTFDESTRGVVGDHVADVLAALHDVDPAAVGLGNLGRHEGALERQLTRWREQFDRMEGDTLDEGGLDGGGLVEWVGETLTRRIPAPQRTSVVHGSYRMDNVVLADDGSVRAVLGWALCTLGDPLTDVGLMLVSWPEPDDTLTLLGPSPSTAPGFSTRAQLLKHYGEASGLDVSGVGYYTAFGYWKLAWILRGLYALGDVGRIGPARGEPSGRRSNGDMVGHAWEGYPAQISRLFEMAAEALESVP